jgi:sensor histidine kinase YesM
VTATIYLINVGCDVAETELFINYRDGEAHSQVYAAVTVFLIFVCELITEKIVTSHDNTDMNPKISLILVPLCGIAVMCVLTYSNACTDVGLAIVSMGLLVINFLMLYLYNLLLHSITQQYENELLRQKLQVYANQLDVIMQSEEKIKILRHDMKHHMNEIKLIANRCDIAEIQEYINHMEEYIQNPNEIVASGNVEIDSVLNYMLQKANKELKNVVVNVSLPEGIKHSFDINVVLGNLLENAIEAARQTDEKYLRVDITLNRGVLRIEIENSYTASDIVQEEKGIGRYFLTTKEKKEQHGIGLKSVSKIVEENNGTMEVTPLDKIFRVNLILYVSDVK